MARANQEINAGSMADIAFLLLIFFLVTTTMNTDTGIMRTLPPMADESVPDKGLDIKERNALQVLVSASDMVLVAGKRVEVWQIKDIAKDFLANPSNAENLPEKEVIEVPVIGAYPVSKGIISLLNDRGTSYYKYIEVQNELKAAVNELRNELATTKFNAPYAKLTDEQQAAINKAIPDRVSEATPVDMTGGKK